MSTRAALVLVVVRVHCTAVRFDCRNPAGPRTRTVYYSTMLYVLVVVYEKRTAPPSIYRYCTTALQADRRNDRRRPLPLLANRHAGERVAVVTTALKYCTPQVLASTQGRSPTAAARWHADAGGGNAPGTATAAPDGTGFRQRDAHVRAQKRPAARGQREGSAQPVQSQPPRQLLHVLS